MATKQTLISQITTAFNNVKLEGGIGLSEANAIDDYKDQQFRAACKKNDEKENWKLIPSSQLNEYYSSLSFFDDKGMRFHLPAFMIADLKGEYHFGMVFVLAHLSDYRKSQFRLLDKKQREVVKFFLEFLAEQPENEFDKPNIESAIENYWSRDVM